MAGAIEILFEHANRIPRDTMQHEESQHHQPAHQPPCGIDAGHARKQEAHGTLSARRAIRRDPDNHKPGNHKEEIDPERPGQPEVR
ncbi:MAG: hypothetical protein VX599_01565 [Pseudomonadota bacterium]|nr:hypothetical protein [Pseudomonadota bacterium]